MEEIIPILVVGTNEPIMQTIARLINKGGKWQATIAFSVDEACDSCRQIKFGVALIGAGLSDEEEISLKARLQILRPQLPIVKHYGGGSGLLFAEIYQGLAQYS